MSVFNMFKELLVKHETIPLSADEQNKVEENKIRNIAQSRLRVSALALREGVGKADIVDLAANIKQNGVIVPLCVRKISSDLSPFGELYEIIGGTRRFFACVSLKIQEIPCLVVENDEENALICRLIDKIHSKPLHYLDEARGIQILIEDFYKDKGKICEILSVSASYISNKLRLLELSDYEKDLVKKNNIEEKLVQAAMKIPNTEKRIEALEYIIYNKLSLDETLRYVEKNVHAQRKTHACIGYSEQKNRILMKSLTETIKNEKILAEVKTNENDREIMIKIKLPKKYK